MRNETLIMWLTWDKGCIDLLEVFDVDVDSADPAKETDFVEHDLLGVREEFSMVSEVCEDGDLSGP